MMRGKKVSTRPAVRERERRKRTSGETGNVRERHGRGCGENGRDGGRDGRSRVLDGHLRAPAHRVHGELQGRRCREEGEQHSLHG